MLHGKPEEEGAAVDFNSFPPAENESTHRTAPGRRPLSELVHERQRPAGRVPEHHPHVVHLQREGALALCRDVEARRPEEETVEAFGGGRR